MSEKLYNGIELPEQWPPLTERPECLQPMRVPYLEQPPVTIPIDLGRQLFVDDFLIESFTMVRQFHRPVKHPGNPVFSPSTDLERNERQAPTAIPKCGGLWYDERERIFKMWYMASYTGALAYAISQDGVRWERPILDVVPGTNLVLPLHIHPDSGTVWLDRTTKDESQRFKMLVREPNPPQDGRIPALLMTSADGIHWTKPVETGPMDDRSTMFHNPFRNKWVQSIRAWENPRFRCRRYWESDDFFESGQWKKGQPIFWTGADCMDEAGDAPPQLYNLDAVAYESLMVGFFQILKGPPNQFGEATGTPKWTELMLATSRDGFHWSRPDRKAFIGARRESGSWEYGYVESTGGICVVVGEELWFYYSAYAGDPKRINVDWTANGMYSNGAVGLAKLRRDGFASMQGRFPGAEVRTRSLLFSGSRLFVNASTAGALLTVDCRDGDNRPIPEFSKEDCNGFNGNSVCTEITWKNGASLASLAGKPVKFTFRLDRGDLYSFWVSDDATGRSGGYLAAGGPGFDGGRDS